MGHQDSPSVDGEHSSDPKLLPAARLVTGLPLPAAPTYGIRAPALLHSEPPISWQLTNSGEMFERYDDNEYAKEIVSLNDQHKWTVALVLEVIKMTQQHDINGEEHKLFLHTQFSLAQVYLCLEQLNNADACRRMATNRRVS